MGVVADAALDGGGEVVLGVIPEFLMRREVAHDGVTDLVVTNSMHSRKQRMFEAADAFVSLPGGLGTLDETIEIITWRQLRLHDKPILLCDVAGSAGAVPGGDRGGDRRRFRRPGARLSFRGGGRRAGGAAPAARTCLAPRRASRRDCSAALSLAAAKAICAALAGV